MPWLWLSVSPNAIPAIGAPGGSDNNILLNEQYRVWTRDLIRGAEHAVDELASFIEGRSFLLVFDDVPCDPRALDELLAELLRRCPGLMIVETTRFPLGRPGRHVIPLRPLSLLRPPNLGAAKAQFHTALQYLLVHIRAVNAEFALSEENLDSLYEVCLALDGLPAALEAAASWFAFCSPSHVAETARSDPFALASGRLGAGAAEDRWLAQTAVSDAIACLSSSSQRVLLNELAGLASPWTLSRIVEDSRHPEVEVVGALNDLLALGLIRPVDAGSESPMTFEVLNLVQHFLR
jgi:predicted ATPase